MFQRIKDFLNNTIVWVLALVAGLFYFWKKEKDLERELAEEKASERIKADEEKQSQLDHAAGNAVDEYERARGEYLRGRDSEVRQGAPGAKGPDKQ